jgi:peptidoglycan/xylan/chitin deacetylase (PgdA/CDA1 family)
MQSLHFLYHELRAVPSTYTYVFPYDEFERHCELFATLRQDDTGTLWPEITFDDGHRSNHDLALPVLERYGLKATFFITVGWIGQRAQYMGWTELRTLRAQGQEIGAHGWSHKLLTHCTAVELDRELAGARKALEDRLAAPVTALSLPGGRVNRRVLAAAWAGGYTTVFTSVPEPAPRSRVAHKTIGRVNVRSDLRVAHVKELLRLESGVLARLERKERAKSLAKTMLGDRLYTRLWAMMNRQEAEAEITGLGVE